MDNILFLIPKNDVGGAPKFVKEQIEICYTSGSFNCFLATNNSGWIDADKSSYLRNILFDINVEKYFSVTFLISLISFCKRNKINLIVCNSANGGLYGRLSAFFLGISSIYVSHGWSSVYNGGKLSFILNYIEYVLSFIGTKVLCISKGDVKKAKENIGIKDKFIVQINNSIYPVPLNQSPSIRTHNKIKILTVTRFRHPKRVDLLISAIQNNNNYELFIVGDGESRPDIEKLIHTNKISNTFLLGEISNFSDWNSYDIFCLISESEGLPMSGIEAMSAGLPLILSDVGGCPELIKNNGELVLNNPKSILEGIEKVSANLSKYSIESKKYFNSNFNLLNRKNEFLHLYLECIHGKSNIE